MLTMRSSSTPVQHAEAGIEVTAGATGQAVGKVSQWCPPVRAAPPPGRSARQDRVTLRSR